MIRVTDLIADSSLELELLSGSAGVDRRVTWSHVAEIPDAAQWLEGGEMLLTVGLGLPADADGQVRYLRSLALAKASCLGIGHRAPRLTEQFLHVADDLRLPIVRVGIDVPFVRIARVIAASNLELSQQRLAVQIRILESLRWWVDSGADAASVFRRLEAVTGFDIFVVDENGVTVLPGMRDAPAHVCSEIVGLRAYPMITGGFGAVVPVKGQSSVFVVLQHRKHDGAGGVVVARQVATVASVQLADLYRGQEEELRRGGEILTGMISGELVHSAATAHLERRGFDTAQPMVLLALRATDQVEIDGRLVHSVLQAAGLPTLMMLSPGHVLVLTQSSLEGIAQVLTGIGLCGGASDPFQLGADMAQYNRQAEWAMQSAGTPPDGLVGYSRARSFSPWLNMSADAIGALVEQVLGPLQLHDRTKGSELLHTLESYFEQERSVTKAAQALFIHPHTLRYRLDKIESLTSRKLSRTRDVAELWWALEARRLPA